LSEQLQDTFGYFCSRLPNSRPETTPSAGNGSKEGNNE